MVHLIIDPAQKRQSQLRAMLISLGHRPNAIHHAGGLSDGVAAVKRRAFDCCFVFVNPTAPEITAAVTGLRAAMVNRPSPLVLYTLEATRAFVLDVGQSGASFLLAYPFTACGVEQALRVCSNVQMST